MVRMAQCLCWPAAAAAAAAAATAASLADR
jgi:hypothetical protein